MKKFTAKKNLSNAMTVKNLSNVHVFGYFTKWSIQDRLPLIINPSNFELIYLSCTNSVCFLCNTFFSQIKSLISDLENESSETFTQEMFKVWMSKVWQIILVQNWIP